jgi:hypothetical protein
MGAAGGPEFLPQGFDVMNLVRQLALPSPETMEKLSYGDPLFRMPTQSNIPITTDRGYLAEVLGMAPAVPPAARATTRLSNQAADALVRAVTRNPEATAPGVLEAAGQMSPLARITAYHGSPYLFRQFDPARVGTGEGAQAYGVGAGYTAEARPVAEEYKRLVQADKSGGFPSFLARSRYAESGGDKEKAAASIEESIARLEKDRNLVGNAMNVDEAIQSYQDALKVLKDIQPNQGYLYKGEIPDEALPMFLDLDKPVSKQPNVMNALRSEAEQRVRSQKIVELENEIRGSMQSQDFGDNFLAMFDDANIVANQEIRKQAQERLEKMDLTKLIEKELEGMKPIDMNWNMTGKDFYELLAKRQGSAINASAMLERQGLRGIRYLDQDSRTGGKNTSNFIPFGSEDFRIQEINDIPIEEYISQGLL